MPLIREHVHEVSDPGDVTLPGSTPTLAEVLAAGNDPGGTDFTGASLGAAEGGTVRVTPASQENLVGGGGFIRGGYGSTAGGSVTVEGGPSPTWYGALLSVGGAQEAFSEHGHAELRGGKMTFTTLDAVPGSARDGGDFLFVYGAGDGAGRNGFVFLNLPTADPGVAGALWSDAGVVKVSAG